jgi:Fe-Mn family superoxide dismutase
MDSQEGVMWQVVNWQDLAKRYAAAKERCDSLLLGL